MLKILKVLTSSKSIVEVDEYVPLTILFEPKDSSATIYWRGGDGKFTLVEIGLSKNTGAVNSVTLTSVSSESVHSVLRSPEIGGDWIEGMPAFDTSCWSEDGDFSSRFIDDFNGEFRFIVGDNNVSLNFGRADSIARYVGSGDVFFGVSSEGVLLSLELMRLDDQKMSVLKGFGNG